MSRSTDGSVIFIKCYKDSNEKAKLIKWKKLVLGKYGFGGLKKRIFEMIEEDLKEQNIKT